MVHDETGDAFSGIKVWIKSISEQFNHLQRCERDLEDRFAHFQEVVDGKIGDLHEKITIVKDTANAYNLRHHKDEELRLKACETQCRASISDLEGKMIAKLDRAKEARGKLHEAVVEVKLEYTKRTIDVWKAFTLTGLGAALSFVGGMLLMYFKKGG